MPSVGEIAQLITAFSAVGALLFSIHNSRKLRVVTAAVEEVHKATNSLQDKLVEATRSDALQTGITEGRALEKAANKT